MPSPSVTLVRSIRPVCTLIGLLLAASVCCGKPPMKEADLSILRAAALRGDHEAEFLLGMQIKAGDGVEKNATEAAAWLRKAADAGLTEAQFALGNLQAEAGEPVDAARWLQSAAEKGNAQAMMSLGELYAQAGNSSADPAAAWRWYLAAAQAGQASAMKALAALYYRGNAPVPRDPAQALHWYRLAAERGDPEAQVLVARVESLIPAAEANREKAMTIWRSETAKGDLAAGLALALLEQKEQTMDEDPAETVRWSLLLAGLRGGDAYFLRGFLLEYGIGMNRDQAAAVVNYRKAAELAHAQGRYRLGLLLAAGEGTVTDPLTAGYWLGRAASQGVAEAAEALASLKRGLTAEQIRAIDESLRE